MSDTVDITGIDKVALLRELWLNSTVASFFYFSNKPAPEFDEVEAAKSVNDYIDYFDGRCIKLNISGDSVKPRLYDQDFGEGKVKEIVDNLRKK